MISSNIGSRGSGPSSVCCRSTVPELLRSFARLFASCQSFFALIHSASNLCNVCVKQQDQIRERGTHPRVPRTCHHLAPPTTRFITSSPPNALIRYTAASSQEAVGITRRTTWTHGGDGVRTFKKDCSSSTVCLR